MIAVDSHKFLVPNSESCIIVCLSEIIEFVERHLKYNPSSDYLIFKTKIIVAELLNNAIKHTKDAETFIEVSFDSKCINIIKTDFGAPFSKNSIIDFFKRPVGFKVQISKDDLHELYMVIENQNKIKFMCENTILSSEIDINNLLEHYGLLIMTKTADEFTYSYNEFTGLNTFNIIISK